MCCLGGCGRAEANSTAAMDFTLHFLSEFLSRVLPDVLQYPQISLFLLDTDLDEALEARDEILKDLQILLDIEEVVANGCPHALRVLRTIVWRHNKAIRLFLNVVLKESHLDHIGPDSLYMARALNERLHDEKAPEDLHQHVRDSQRNRRHKNVQLSSIFASHLASGVLEAREVQCPQVSSETLAQKAWYAVTEKAKTKMNFAQIPEDWPDFMNQICMPDKAWPSPGVPGQLVSAVAWHWLKCRGDGDTSLEPWFFCKAWWSRLCSKHQVITHLPRSEHYLVALVTQWGVLAINVGSIDGTTWSSRKPKSGYHIVHLFVSSDWLTTPVIGALHDDCLVLRQGGSTDGILQAVLARRVDMETCALVLAAYDVEDPQPSVVDLQRCQPKALRQTLINAAFFDNPGRAKNS